MNIVQIPNRYEAQINELDVLYRRCFRHIATIRTNAEKLRQASNLLAEIASGTCEEIEGDEDND
jgi:hypothetical protein